MDLPTLLAGSSNLHLPQSHPEARLSPTFNITAPQSFRCQHKGCNRAFKRKDHLLRHTANHNETVHHCGHCGRGFKRQDLLQRHERNSVCKRHTESPSTPQRRKSRTRTNSAQVSPSLTPQLPSPTFEPIDVPMSVMPTIDPHALDAAFPHDLFLPDPSSLSAAAPGFGVNFTAGWENPSWQLDPWESMLQEHDVFRQQDTPRTLPLIQEDTPVSVGEAALLAIINATLPELAWDATFLKDAIASYWTNVAPSYPFVHRGTFDFESATPQLVAMMAIVGTRHMTLVPPRDFLGVVRKIRGDLVQQCGYEMPVTTLQAFCLCHVHDCWYGTLESQFVAQCMWPIMVAYTRKKGTAVVGRAENEADEEEAWVAWAKDEERRRAAFSVLLCDTQLSAFWNQHCSRQISIFAHNMALPCPKGQWEAQTASEWLRLRHLPDPQQSPSSTGRPPRSSYLPGLHPEFHVSSVAEGYSTGILSSMAASSFLPFKVDLDNYLGVEMVLMGLMAAAWDCRTKGGMGIKFGDGLKQWRPIVLKALINLREHWENQLNPLSPSIPVRDLRDTFAISIISALSDIPMLQVAAGATGVSGAEIGPRQYKDAQRRLRMWAKTEDAWTCVWQSARYLRQTLFADWGIYTSWAVHLTTLVLWAYGWSQAKDAEQIPPPTYSPHHRATQLLDYILAAPSGVELIHRGINDVVVCAAEKMVNTRIDRECGALLWRLVGSNYAKRPAI